MNLATAQRYADQILPWLAPFCERIEIVGSIRRRRPICNDVDIVCIPKLSSETVQIDMFHTEQKVTNQVRAHLIGYIKDPEHGASWSGRNGTPGPEPKPEGQNLLLQLRKCQLDLWCATEETYATLKLYRTGSMQHNVWLCQRAESMGGKWSPYRGLIMAGKLQPAFTEESIYKLLDLPFVTPENRELEYLRRLPCK